MRGKIVTLSSDEPRDIVESTVEFGTGAVLLSADAIPQAIDTRGLRALLRYSVGTSWSELGVDFRSGIYYLPGRLIHLRVQDRDYGGTPYQVTGAVGAIPGGMRPAPLYLTEYATGIVAATEFYVAVPAYARFVNIDMGAEVSANYLAGDKVTVLGRYQPPGDRLVQQPLPYPAGVGDGAPIRPAVGEWTVRTDHGGGAWDATLHGSVDGGTVWTLIGDLDAGPISADDWPLIRATVTTVGTGSIASWLVGHAAAISEPQVLPHGTRYIGITSPVALSLLAVVFELEL